MQLSLQQLRFFKPYTLTDSAEWSWTNAAAIERNRMLLDPQLET